MQFNLAAQAKSTTRLHANNDVTHDTDFQNKILISDTRLYFTLLKQQTVEMREARPDVCRFEVFKAQATLA